MIKFKCPKLLKFHGKLNSNQYAAATKTTAPSTASTNILDQYVKYDYDEENLIIMFLIQLPTEGQYGLDIYARDPDYQSEKRTMSHCCKYIINYSKASNNVEMVTHTNPHLYHDYSFDKQKSNGQGKGASPQVSSSNNKSEQSLSPRKSSSLAAIRNSHNVLAGSTASHDTNGSATAPSLPLPMIGGNTILLSQFGMTPISHADPTITVHSANSIELQFQIRKMVDFTFDLIYHHSLADLASRTPAKNLNQRLNASDYVTIKPNGGFNVIFALNLPQQGVYTFTIYAATTNDGNGPQMSIQGHTELPAVFTYLLRYV